MDLLLGTPVDGGYETGSDEDPDARPFTVDDDDEVPQRHGDWDTSWSMAPPLAPARPAAAAAASRPAPAATRSGEDVLEAWEEQRWTAMRAAGHSEADVARARKTHATHERIAMLLLIERSRGDFDAAAVGLELAQLLVDTNAAYRAFEVLARARERCPTSTALPLAEAKLLFKEDRKGDASAACSEVIALATAAASDAVADSARDAADAHYLLGWIDVHAGCHSRAYRTWARGADACPFDARLAKQRRKRRCWDEGDAASEEPATGDALAEMIGAGAHSDGVWDAERDVDAFAIAPHVDEPALAIYAAATQRRRAVFRTRAPLLTASECAAVVRTVETHVRSGGGGGRGGWGTVRHSSVPTTDIAVEDVPALRSWLRTLLTSRLYPMLAACFPQLADGTTLGVRGERLRVHDAFIVRYDATRDMSLSLPAHSDTSAVSFTLALNGDRAGAPGDAHYHGGGTWYKALAQSARGEGVGGDAGDGGGGGAAAVPDADAGVVNASEGNAVAFIGPLRHAGHPIHSGTRLILVLFLYVEGFEYGRFVGYDGEPQECDALHSETGDNSFVVYKETHALLGAREREIER